MDLTTLLRLARKALFKRGRFPEYVLFQVTSLCNVRCAHCFLWEDTNHGWENTNFGRNDLSLDEIRRIADHMPPFYFMNITGGEPFLREDLPEIVEIFYKRNRLRGLLVPTNGTATRRVVNSVAQILERCPKLAFAVDISLDGIGEAHDRIRGAQGTYRRAVKTFQLLRSLQRRYPDNLQLGVIIAFMRSNQEHVNSIYDRVSEELHPDSISVALIRGTALDREEKNIDIDKYQSLVRRLEADLRARRLTGFRRQLLAPITLAAKIMMHREIVRTVKEGFQAPCMAARLNVVIYSNGDVYPCEMLGPEHRVGGLRDVSYDFRKLWKSRKRRSVAEWVVNSRCFCTHECHVPVNLLFNPRRLPELLTLGASLR